MERERRLATSIAAALLMLGVCAGRSQAADHLGSAIIARGIGAGGTIYAIGGGTDHYDRLYRCYSVVETYSPRTNTWSKRTPLPQPMCGATAGSTSRGTIAAVGGSKVQGGEQASRITVVTGGVVALTPGAARWAIVVRTPFPRKQAGAVVAADGTIYVIGGADAFGKATATVQRRIRSWTP